MIPRRFMRVWLGPNPIPEMFEQWWAELGALHPGWELVTLREPAAKALLDFNLRMVYDDCPHRSNQSDVLRYAALEQIGGIYLDVDVMPLRSFEPLLGDRSFAPMRSSKSLSNAIIGSPAGSPAARALVADLPRWYWAQEKSKPFIGPPHFNSVWNERDDVRRIARTVFYPHGQKWEFGRGPEKQAEKDRVFAERDFPEETIAVHYSSMKWGSISKEKRK